MGSKHEEKIEAKYVPKNFYKVCSCERINLYLNYHLMRLSFYGIIGDKIKRPFCTLILISVLGSCSKTEAQYLLCNLAQNVDPFVCYGILE